VLDLIPETAPAVFVLFGAEGNLPADMRNEGTWADRSFIGHRQKPTQSPDDRLRVPEVDGRNRRLQAESGWSREGHV
jgi:hypothetical protein